MKTFIHENFLLHTRASQRLYRDFAVDQPIFDYHCHLNPKDIAENRQFKNLFEIWLEGDHYKWRAMRANGIPEECCTGCAEPLAKFQAWAKTIPHTLRNPLYHWTHLELKRVFGIDESLNEQSASRIWKKANAQLADASMSVHGILRKFNVTALCTTDDPTDDLAYHKKIARSGLLTKVYPAFRPDKGLGVDQPKAFNVWVEKLESAVGGAIHSFAEYLDALEERHTYFHQNGCRLSDHGLTQCFATPCTEKAAAAIFNKARKGVGASPEETQQFGTFLMLQTGRLDARRGWVKQLHIGAARNLNSRRMQELGPDTGFDAIGDWPQGQSLGRYLDLLEREGALPRTILYNHNPCDNYTFATVASCFQDGVIPGKIQFGAGWWFLDQKEGMEWQLNALSNLGLLSRFVGMVTDSRSFLSYPRHEYFRRILCNLIGQEMERGELPGDFNLVGDLVRRICYDNAVNYFPLAVADVKKK